MLYAQRQNERRETLIEDRTKCHADHVGQGLDRCTTAAVALLKAVEFGDRFVCVCCVCVLCVCVFVHMCCVCVCVCLSVYVMLCRVSMVHVLIMHIKVWFCYTPGTSYKGIDPFLSSFKKQGAKTKL